MTKKPMPEDPSVFPCEFPIKIFGETSTAFEEAVLEIVKKHFQDINDFPIQKRSSKDNRYLALTITVYANSREQMDALYQELSSHELVTMVL